MPFRTSNALAYLLIATFLLAAAGCRQSKESATGAATAGEGEKRYRIAVIPKGTSHDFWNSVKAGVDKAAEELNVDVTWKGPQSESQIDRQIEIVENYVGAGYDGICLAPSNAVALRQPVELAIQRNVPVVIFDSGLEDMEGVVSYVATNNYRGGERAGQHLAELLGGTGNVILMRYDVGSASTEQREQGFLDAIAKFEGIELLVSDRYAGADESKAVDLGERLLDKYGERLDGIFCPNQSTASGMLTALVSDRRELAGKVQFIGFDSGANIARGLEQGQMQATVLQDPVQMGYDTVRVMVEHLDGKEVDERIEVPEALATTENLDDPKIHSLLYPEGQQ